MKKRKKTARHSSVNKSMESIPTYALQAPDGGFGVDAMGQIIAWRDPKITNIVSANLIPGWQIVQVKISIV